MSHSMSNSTLTVANLADWVGNDIGTSEWITVGQDRIDEFARCTGDSRERGLSQITLG